MDQRVGKVQKKPVAARAAKQPPEGKGSKRTAGRDSMQADAGLVHILEAQPAVPPSAVQQMRRAERYRQSSGYFRLAAPIGQPAWAESLLDLAAEQLAHLPAAEIVLNTWSDCAGMGTEVFALKTIAKTLAARDPRINIKVNPYMACDVNPNCLRFVEINHDPVCMATDMLDRHIQFETNSVSVKDVVSTDSVLVPRGAIDVYVLGFPCTPWSRRGTGGGFTDPNSRPLEVGLKTIKELQPKLFVLECVLVLSFLAAANQSAFTIISRHASACQPIAAQQRPLRSSPWIQGARATLT